MRLRKAMWKQYDKGFSDAIKRDQRDPFKEPAGYKCLRWAYDAGYNDGQKERAEIVKRLTAETLGGRVKQAFVDAIIDGSVRS
jgi:DNA-binding SARP family transcriptional activator